MEPVRVGVAPDTGVVPLDAVWIVLGVEQVHLSRDLRVAIKNRS